jgi:CBS domain-containing protein
MKKLREIVRPDFLFMVPPEATVAQAVAMMTANNVGIVAVVEGERLVGVFSERDVVQRVVDRGLDARRTAVAAVMTTEVITADADEDYGTAMRRMDEANIRHLPVTRAGRLLSMLSIRDLMRVEIQARSAEIRDLQEYLYQVPAERTQIA